MGRRPQEARGGHGSKNAERKNQESDRPELVTHLELNAERYTTYAQMKWNVEPTDVWIDHVDQQEERWHAKPVDESIEHLGWNSSGQEEGKSNGIGKSWDKDKLGRTESVNGAFRGRCHRCNESGQKANDTHQFEDDSHERHVHSEDEAKMVMFDVLLLKNITKDAWPGELEQPSVAFRRASPRLRPLGSRHRRCSYLTGVRRLAHGMARPALAMMWLSDQCLQEVNTGTTRGPSSDRPTCSLLPRLRERRSCPSLSSLSSRRPHGDQ